MNTSSHLIHISGDQSNFLIVQTFLSLFCFPYCSFTVDSSNGSIRASKVLDYEKNKEFMFFLLANDGGRFFEEDKRYVTTIRVSLRDINDNQPVFLETPYAADIMENQTDVVFVYQVSDFLKLNLLVVKQSSLSVTIKICKRRERTGNRFRQRTLQWQITLCSVHFFRSLQQM